MPWQRPTLAVLIERVQADIASRLPGTDPRLRRSVVGALARTHAGSVHGLYGYLDWMSRQIMPDTAEAERLARWAGVWGLSRKPAAPAGGDVELTGTDGSVVPAGTLLQRSDGAEFATDAEATISGGTATVAVTASEAGADGNTAAASELTFVSPVAGVDATATVASGGLTGGTDTESDDDLRSRLLSRISHVPPHGGKGDYADWAMQVSGVTRAWDFAEWVGLGTVGVTCVLDDQAGSIIPDAAKVQEVQDYIDARRPMPSAVTVFAPTAVTLDFTIAVTPDTTAVRDAVTAELEDLLRREAEPGGTILLSHIREAISLAQGETDHTLVSPVADVTHAAGELPVLGTITWQ